MEVGVGERLGCLGLRCIERLYREKDEKYVSVTLAKNDDDDEKSRTLWS